MKDKDKCPGFGSKDCDIEAALPHKCPFKWEINGDETECMCCNGCRGDCADEV